MNGNCDVCGTVIDGVYATSGGSVVPYLPAKEYHLACIPKLVPQRKTIEKSLDEIVRSILPTANAGWTRKRDVGSFKIYELCVPKSFEEDPCDCSSPAEARRCTKHPALGAPYDLSKPSLTWEEAASKVHTEYQVPYAADGNYHIPDHAGDTIRIIKPEEEL